jgi:hypothetical protein
MRIRGRYHSILPRILRGLAFVLLVITLSACAIRPYAGSNVEEASFLSRSSSQTSGAIKVTVAVPDAGETETLTGLNLYQQGVQPVWLKIENSGSSPARVAIWSIDRDYFSPIEVAYMNRKKYSASAYPSLEKWFYENALPRDIPAGETRSGFVFTHLKPGTKGFNLNLFSDNKAHEFTFFVPLPGFVARHMQVDFDSLYPPDAILDLSKAELPHVLKHEVSCCATDSTEKLAGGPLNVVMVGSGLALRRSLLRGHWVETAAELDESSRALQQNYRGRPPDVIYSQLRDDGNEEIQLLLWLTPWRVDSEPVWVGETSYRLNDDSVFGTLVPGDFAKNLQLHTFFARESVAADIDSAQSFLFQNFWYGGSLLKMGFIDGVGAASVENPRSGLNGTLYFTQGLRVVMFLSENPVGLDEAELIDNFELAPESDSRGDD